MTSAELRVAVLGASGALGGEVLSLLSESSLAVAEIRPVATERSVGQEIEFRGELHAVRSELGPLRGLDLVFLCAPAGASLEAARQALHAEVPCVDVAGALAGSPEVEPCVAAFGPPDPHAPLLVAPPGHALPWALVLHPLQERVGLRRVVGTALQAASRGGREGIESLYRESLAIFNQEELPEPEVFGRPVAFDCLSTVGEIEEGGATRRESAAAAALSRLLRTDAPLSLAEVQVPAFVGFGATAAIELAGPLDPKQAGELLDAAPGVTLWRGEPDGLTLRAAAGSEQVLVGRLRQDPGVEHGLLLWLAADPLRLAAVNAVRLAVARLGRHH